jgi:hypothetical protein
MMTWTAGRPFIADRGRLDLHVANVAIEGDQLLFDGRNFLPRIEEAEPLDDPFPGIRVDEVEDRPPHELCGIGRTE